MPEPLADSEAFRPYPCPKCGGQLVIQYVIRGMANANVLGVTADGDLAIEGLDFDATPSSRTSEVFCDDCDYHGTSRRNRMNLR